MAFPPAGFPGTGPTPGSTALDYPPPSPTPMSGPPDASGNFSMRGIAGPMPPVSSNAMPPEVLTGVAQSAKSVSDMFNAWAQVAPDQAPILTQLQQLLQQFLANVMQSGAGPTTPTATGPAFPGGGMDRGIAGAGTV